MIYILYYIIFITFDCIYVCVLFQVQSVDEESGRYLRYGGCSESDDDDVSNATQEYVRLSVRRGQADRGAPGGGPGHATASQRSLQTVSLVRAASLDSHMSHTKRVCGEEQEEEEEEEEVDADGYDGDAASGYHSDGPSSAVGHAPTSSYPTYPRRARRCDFELLTNESGSRCQSPSMASSVSSSGFTTMRTYPLHGKVASTQYKTRLRVPWQRLSSRDSNPAPDNSNNNNNKDGNNINVEATTAAPNNRPILSTAKRSFDPLDFPRGSSCSSVCTDPSMGSTVGDKMEAQGDGEEGDDDDDDEEGEGMTEPREQSTTRRCVRNRRE